MPQILGQGIGPIGYGLMGLTWRPKPAPEEQAFEAMKASLASGCNFWNVAEFYGTPEYNSLHLVNKYFTKYPEDADRVVLNVKGGIDVKKLIPDGTPEGIASSIGNCLRILDGKKKIDVFEPARVDRNTDIEVTMKALEEQVKAGNIGGIGLSEVSAATIRKAAAVTKIVCVETELSLWTMDILTNGVATTCAELDIPIVAYSPIGRGMLTGQIKSRDDIPEGDFRLHYPRFSVENFEGNLEIVRHLQAIAKQKGCTAAQLAIGWVTQLSKKDGNPVIIPIPGATTADRVNENATETTLSNSELADISSILEKMSVTGERYPGQVMHTVAV